MAKLVALSEGLTGRSYDLKVDKTTIGRVEDNSFHLAEPSVSSHHCEVLLQGSEVRVKDLNSTNGTYINGEKITDAVLKPGQILRLGSIELRLEVEGMPSAPTTPSAPPAKKNLDQTRVLPRGVKVNEFEQGTQRPKLDSTVFAKKSNKTTMIFIGVGVVLGLVIIVFLIMAAMKVGGTGG
jgi:pSer/pThr/pTyr-binding forkhead associated (FHA) protein